MMKAYDTERRYMGKVTRDLAMVNYDKSIYLAKKLNLSKNQAETFISLVDKLVPSVLPKQSILETGLSLGFFGADVTRNLTNANAEVSKFLAASK